VVNDSGAFAGWLHRHFAFTAPRSQFAACLGAMGYGVPGAIGTQLARPGGQVVALVGDGGFLMTGQEIVTGVQQKLPFVVLLVDNGMYGSIATHQYRRGGLDALYGTVMNSPDFAALATAYGAASWRVERTEDFPAALDAALAVNDRPALLHIRTDMRNLNADGPQMAE
jgi:acetolactate synthase-1/2/3 large subunit